MSGTLLHNKALFFYPPVVDDTRTFELAARGYAPRVDKLHRDKGYRKDLGAMEAVYDKMNREKYETERCTGTYSVRMTFPAYTTFIYDQACLPRAAADYCQELPTLGSWA